MILGLEKMEGSLLMLANDLDSLRQRYMEMLAKDSRDGFQGGIESIRDEMFKMLEASKKAKDIVAKLY